jgi:heme-degrading monooxygenase HmoA
MPHPHEDLEKHALVDHRTGGPPVAFARGSWWAIDIAHLKADRVDAGVSTYETLIEHARSAGSHARTAAVLRATSGRRVVAIVGLDGHDGFRRLASAWDDHHLYAEHHAVSESVALALYSVAGSAGDAEIDPASHDAYAFERSEGDPAHIATAMPAFASAAGFVGALVFGKSDATRTILVTRFSHAPEYAAFRASAAAKAALGDARASGESAFAVHAVKTFA